MAGSVAGGKQARDSNKAKHGDDFYRVIGSIGGKISRGGGFTSETARRWGKVGGTKSRRKPRFTVD